MDHVGGGCGSQYRREIGEVICARMETGETLVSIGADPDMPCKATITRWRAVHPEFAAMYARVRRELRRGKVQDRRDKHVSDAWRIPHEIKLGLRKPHNGGGRKSTYDRKWARKFCARVASGETLTAITSDPAMPSMKAVYGWLKRHEEFLDMYLEAKADQKRWLEFMVQMIVMEATPATLKQAKEEVARLEGQIGRMTPKTYQR